MKSKTYQKQDNVPLRCRTSKFIKTIGRHLAKALEHDAILKNASFIDIKISNYVQYSHNTQEEHRSVDVVNQ